MPDTMNDPKTMLTPKTTDLIAPALRRMCRMLFLHNTARPASTSMLLLITVLISTLAPSHAVAGSADEPDLEGCISAFLKARSWVDDFDLPDADSDAGRVHIEGATGVCVVLRSRGRVLGVGVDEIQFSASENVDGSLRRALGRAMGEVLRNESIANMDETMLPVVGKGLTIELEIAGRATPLLGRTWSDANRAISPGMDGIAMRRDDQWAVQFPAQLRARNAGAKTASLLQGLALKLDLGAVTLATLNQRDDVSVYRFRPISLAQSTPDGLPFETYRGDKLLPLRPDRDEDIVGFADRLAQRIGGGVQSLDEHKRPLPLGINGNYAPISDTYDPVLATPRDQALAAIALARYSNAPGVDTASARLAREIGERILTDLAIVDPGEEGPVNDLVACGMIILAIDQLPGALDFRPVGALKLEATRVMLRSFSPATGFVQVNTSRNDAGEEERSYLPLQPSGHAILAYALITLCHDNPDEFQPGLGAAAIKHAWASAEGLEQVALLPWIGWAEESMGHLGTGRIENASRLATLHDLVEATRLIRRIEDQFDLAGGLALTRRLPDGSCIPAATSLAWALDVPAVMPSERRDRAVLGMRLTMRFLRQLQVTERNVWTCRNRERAYGGVRVSNWNSNQPIAAQALALIAAVETLEAILPGR